MITLLIKQTKRISAFYFAVKYNINYISGGLLIMRLHYCGHQSCRKRLPLNIRYCDEHKADGKQANEFARQQYFRNYNSNVRDQVANDFYHSAQWSKTRDYVVARDMNVCQVCGSSIESRVVVDHVHPLKFSSDEKLDSNNLWCLCYRCHEVKSMIERQTLSSPNGDNKLRHMSKDWYEKQILRLRARKK